MNASQPIGIFDSGIGGTSIFKEVQELLPLEHIIYLADSKNAPYGEKSRQEIQRLSFKNTDLLVNMNCKLVIVACNTATTNAIKELRTHYSIPIIGIEPAIKPAALNSKKKAIGILATKGTLSSELFTKTSGLFAKDIHTIEVVGKGLVEAIEEGREDSPQTYILLKNLLQPMLRKGIDYLVLGCSHYPYLIPQLKRILPPEVKIIDSGEAVARQTKNVLKDLDLLSIKKQKDPVFYTNKDPIILSYFVNRNNKSYLVSYLDF